MSFLQTPLVPHTCTARGKGKKMGRELRTLSVVLTAEEDTGDSICLGVFRSGLDFSVPSLLHMLYNGPGLIAEEARDLQQSKEPDSHSHSCRRETCKPVQTCEPPLPDSVPLPALLSLLHGQARQLSTSLLESFSGP